MLDISLRPLKDPLFRPVTKILPSTITPNKITIAAFFAGLSSCISSALDLRWVALIFWGLNRALDCLDGALAREKEISSELGGFLDLLGDFVVYSLIPIGIVLGKRGQVEDWVTVAVLEATFHINNFVLLYVSAVAAKADGKGDKQRRELTSLVMRPALVEGFESGVLFTLMIAFPEWVTIISRLMSFAVSVGIVQRIIWIIPALGQLDAAISSQGVKSGGHAQ